MSERGQRADPIDPGRRRSTHRGEIAALVAVLSAAGGGGEADGGGGGPARPGRRQVGGCGIRTVTGLARGEDLPCPLSKPEIPCSVDRHPGSRTPTAVDAIAEEHFAGTVRLSPWPPPILASPDVTGTSTTSPPPASLRSRNTAAPPCPPWRAVPADAVDVVTIAAMKERLGLAEAMYDAGLEAKSLNVLASPLQTVRDTFDLMPTDTDERWRVLAARLAKVPTALAQYAESLRFAKSSGRVSPAASGSPRAWPSASGSSHRTATSPPWWPPRSRATRTRPSPPYADGAGVAASAYATLGEVLRDELLPAAPESDACGIDTYRLSPQYVPRRRRRPEETYHRGQELARISADMAVVAERIRPGATVQEAIEILDADPAYRLEGTDALREWMQEPPTGDRVAGRHAFRYPRPDSHHRVPDRPDPDRRHLPPGPSDDFSRPGRMWWSVPRA